MEGKATVLTPNGRRQNIKVSPNMTLLQILEETCRKHGFDSEEYCLKHHNKVVGLTQMFRFSGLPNNCLLEMGETERRRTVSEVDICVQLEDGSRTQGVFNPTNSLWQVAEQLITITLGTFTSPVAIYMRQEIIGKEQMMHTTLKSLGIIEGRAMIRVIDKNPEELKRQANVYVPQVAKIKTKNVDAESATSQQHAVAIEPGAVGFALTTDVVKSLKKSSSSEENEHAKDSKSANTYVNNNAKFDWDSSIGYIIRNSEHEDSVLQYTDEARDLKIEPEILIVGERNAILFSLNGRQKQVEDLPDSFFDLTVHDLKLVLRDLRSIATGSENTPLLTERLRQLEKNKTMLNKIAQYKNCVIRIQFPNRYVLQGMFKPVEQITDVVAFVRKFLLNDALDFHLFTIPPKQVLPLDKTLLELDFVPTAVIHFAVNFEEVGSEDSVVEQSFLKHELMEKLSSFDGALFAANKMRILKPKVVVKDVQGKNIYLYQSDYEVPDPLMNSIPKRNLSGSKRIIG